MDAISRQHVQPNRRRHSQRLSSDSSATGYTVTSLPAYSSARSFYSDKPPDYADDADLEDTTDDDEQLRSPTSPTLRKRHSHTRRSSSAQQSTADPYLDSLLERSVHALELSNVLLQSTMNSRSSLNASMAHDRIVDRNLELSATFLNNRIRDTSDIQEEWMDDLEGVVRDVRDLYGDTDSVSRSLPSGSSPPPIHALGIAPGGSHRRRSSHGHSSERPRLRLSHSPPTGSQYMSPPPRALTQYVSVSSAQGDASESTADSESIYLPSTIGLQSSAHISSFRPSPRRPDALRLHHSNASTPGFIEYGRRDSYDWTPTGQSQSHRRHRSGIASPRASGSSRTSGSITSPSPSRRSMESSSDTHRRSSSNRGRGSAVWAGSSVFQQQGSGSLARSRSLSDSRGASRSRSHTPPAAGRMHTPVLPQIPRPMTPHQEESPPGESVESSDANDSPPNVQRTVESLRAILGKEDTSPRREKSPQPPKVPAFLLPRSPSVTALAGTSTATASVSRLFTRGTHSTRDAPTPRPSLKPPGGGSPRDSMAISAPSSGRSTPRQVAFAQLPEPYSAEGTRKGFGPEGRKGKGKEKDGGKDKDKKGEGGWWNLLFGAANPPGGAHASPSRMEDRVEDRMARTWARTGSGQATLEDFLY
ncbi:hypothetical protein EXIGLDRAFT_743728 [Exidia glandulosa HHB12029]|uniref:Uncharacterized protein n=1 Tax=Exidia glandulosa HHB12029 TaxID=1314781 RepID=A0A166BUH9_EXIGL|nr:hypothetical protein EXIGLDRAFT_743728 [Exidia glandulosa HHB12029]